MDWVSIGGRIRRQREFLGYTREQFAELLDVTPKFCSDIELGVKGMSVQTLCRISEVLRLSTDFILFGRENAESSSPITQLLRSCSPSELAYAEQLLKTFIMAMLAVTMAACVYSVMSSLSFGSKQSSGTEKPKSSVALSNTLRPVSVCS